MPEKSTTWRFVENPLSPFRQLIVQPSFRSLRSRQPSTIRKTLVRCDPRIRFAKRVDRCDFPRFLQSAGRSTRQTSTEHRSALPVLWRLAVQTVGVGIERVVLQILKQAAVILTGAALGRSRRISIRVSHADSTSISQHSRLLLPVPGALATPELVSCTAPAQSRPASRCQVIDAVRPFIRVNHCLQAPSGECLLAASSCHVRLVIDILVVNRFALVRVTGSGEWLDDGIASRAPVVAHARPVGIPADAVCRAEIVIGEAGNANVSPKKLY